MRYNEYQDEKDGFTAFVTLSPEYIRADQVYFVTHENTFNDVLHWAISELAHNSIIPFTEIEIINVETDESTFIYTMDDLLERAWCMLSNDIEIDEDDDCIMEWFGMIPKDTPLVDVWHWFDERYSKGVYHLMYHVGSFITDK